MFKLIAFFAILAAAFAAPKPNPILTYSAEILPGYPSIGSPITYTNLGYNYVPGYASGYGYYGTPLAYRDLYY